MSMGKLRFKIGIGLFNYRHKIMLMNSMEELNPCAALPVCGSFIGEGTQCPHERESPD